MREGQLEADETDGHTLPERQRQDRRSARSEQQVQTDGESQSALESRLNLFYEVKMGVMSYGCER
jgi:hypothetical protein